MNVPIDTPAEFDDEAIIYWMGWMMDAQRRTYDVHLAVLAALSGAEHARELQALHESGQFLYPPVYVQESQNE